MRVFFVLVALVLAAMAAAARAGEGGAAQEGRPRPWQPDAWFAQAGRANETSTYTLGLQWNWRRKWHVGERARVSGYNEVSIGHWRADRGGGSGIVTQIGFTPVLRYWPSGAETGWFYEVGIGVNALTPVYRTREKRFSTAFNFGDHLAIGHRSSGTRGWEWSLRVQHYSNAGIDQPNPGENFVQARLVVPLRNEES